MRTASMKKKVFLKQFIRGIMNLFGDGYHDILRLIRGKHDFFERLIYIPVLSNANTTQLNLKVNIFIIKFQHKNHYRRRVKSDRNECISRQAVITIRRDWNVSGVMIFYPPTWSNIPSQPPQMQSKNNQINHSG